MVLHFSESLMLGKHETLPVQQSFCFLQPVTGSFCSAVVNDRQFRRTAVLYCNVTWSTLQSKFNHIDWIHCQQTQVASSYRIGIVATHENSRFVYQAQAHRPREGRCVLGLH